MMKQSTEKEEQDFPEEEENYPEDLGKDEGDSGENSQCCSANSTRTTPTQWGEHGGSGKIKLEKLVLRNFKSFRKADLPLSKGFTAIVGANGSGKSNVLDALMFVFGATSLKSMRVSKLSELVNHEAEDSTARVEIVFKKDESEFRVARKIDKTGKSVYRLGEKRVSLNEVETFLSGIGIRPDGHNIVAQGDITKLIDMNPKQRREIIDEIAGIKEYDEKKDEALKKLEKVEKKISDIRIVVSERGAYLKQVEKERHAAIRHNELQAEGRCTKATIIREEIRVIRNDAASKEKRIEALSKSAGHLREEKNRLAESESELEKKNEELTQRIISSGEKTYAQIGRLVEEKRAEIRIEEERQRSAEEKAAGAKRVLSDRRNKAGQCRDDAAAKKQKLESNTLRLAETERLLGPLEAKRNEGKEAFEKLYPSLREKENLLAEAEKRFESARKALLIDENAIVGGKKEIEIIKGELESIRENTKRLGIGERKKKVEVFLGRLERAIELIGKVKGVGEECANSLAELAETAGELASEAREMKENLDELAGERKAKEYASRIEAIALETGRREKEINSLRERLKESEAEKTRLKEEAAAIKEAINGLLIRQTGEQHEKLIRAKEQLKDENTRLFADIENSEKRVKELEEEIKVLEADLPDGESQSKEKRNAIERLKGELREREAELDKSSAASKVLEEERKRILEKIKVTGERISHISIEVEQKERQINEINLEFSKNEVRLSDLEEELAGYKDEKTIEGKTIGALKNRLIEIEKEIKSLGAINMKALEDFDGIRKELLEVEMKADKLEEEKNSVVDMIEKMEGRKRAVFMDCFARISAKFSQMYYSLFEGEGSLELTNRERPFEGGLMIQARYKEGKLKSIDAMSGGEKTLTALAFIFAIQEHEAAPFYILDEADAALDAANSAKFVKLITENSKARQFIVVTHNDIITKESDQIIGVAKNKQNSSVIGLKLKGRTGEEAA